MICEDGFIRVATCGFCAHPLAVSETKITATGSLDRRPVLEGECPRCGFYNVAQIPWSYARGILAHADRSRADVQLLEELASKRTVQLPTGPGGSTA